MKKQRVFVLLLLLLLRACVAAAAYQNVALRGKASQSTRFEHAFGDAHSAIDGNRDDNFNHGSCTHTAEQREPWWTVDLLDPYAITSITITNRQDCCQNRLSGVRIHIGNNNGLQNPVATSIASVGKEYTHNFTKPVEGRYVTLSLPGRTRILSLCEVEVFGYPAPTGENQRSSTSVIRQQVPVSKRTRCSHRGEPGLPRKSLPVEPSPVRSCVQRHRREQRQQVGARLLLPHQQRHQPLVAAGPGPHAQGRLRQRHQHRHQPGATRRSRDPDRRLPGEQRQRQPQVCCDPQDPSRDVRGLPVWRDGRSLRQHRPPGQRRVPDSVRGGGLRVPPGLNPPALRFSKVNQQSSRKRSHLIQE